MNETEFHQLSDQMLEFLSDALENADQDGRIDVELIQGVLTLSLPHAKTIIISKHGISRQLWVSSPLSGGTHFSYADGTWVLADGRELLTLLRQELQQLAGIEL